MRQSPFADQGVRGEHASQDWRGGGGECQLRTRTSRGHRPARLRLLKRKDVQQRLAHQVARRHGTWVEMTVEDSDNDDEERDSPVESCVGCTPT